MKKLNVIFENESLLAINKPAGFSFHNDNNKLGVASHLKLEKNTPLWPVHRLDKITSGLLLFAKSKDSAIVLNQLFINKTIHKTYIALSDRKPKKKQGQITGDMVKSRNGTWMLTKNKHNPAITHFSTCSLIPGKRFFWIQPITGKTHQIRVALKAMGAPILGDTRYQGSPADRGYLHAYQLNFPWRNNKLIITCPPHEGTYFTLPELASCIKKFT